MKKSKFKIGDKCKIKKFGQLVTLSTKNFPETPKGWKLLIKHKNGLITYDQRPDFVGEKVTITEIESINYGDGKVFEYCIKTKSKLPIYNAWWDESNLEKI